MKENNPLISVIIPVYNAEKDIESTLDSICNQTYRNIEIVVSDDASTDSSVEAVEKYIKKDSRVLLVKNSKNGGQGKAMRAGIDHCKGSIISFVDSDDYLKENIIEKCVKLMDETDSDIVSFGFSSGSFNSGYEYYVFDEPRVITGIDAIPEMMKKNGLDSNSWGKLYKKQLYDGVVFDEGRYENISVTWRVLSKASKVCISGLLGYSHTIRSDQVTAGYYSPKDWTFISLTQKLVNDIEEEYPEYVDSAIHMHLDGVKFIFSKIQYGGEMDKEKYSYISKTFDGNFAHYLKSSNTVRDMIAVILLRIRLYGLVSKIISKIDRMK